MAILNAPILEGQPGGTYLLQALQDLEARMTKSPLLAGLNRISWGAGPPEGRIVGVTGDLYCRTDGGTNTTLYVKETSARPNFGWKAK